VALRWIHESPACWDRAKAELIAKTPAGSLAVEPGREGEVVPGEWWRAEDGSTVVGYGRMDEIWGEAQILVAVDPAAQKRGVGSFILEQLEGEALRRGFRYLYNVVPETHPDGGSVTRWLEKRGFRASEDGKELRRTVRARPQQG
jgi:GNAT superfamily N-acetyltransferase